MLYHHEYVALTCVTFYIITPSTHVEKGIQRKLRNSPCMQNLVVASMMIYYNRMMVLS